MESESLCIDAAPFPKPLLEIPADMLAQFESGINRTDDCWLWTRGTGSKGYGVAYVKVTGERDAHRVAYTLWCGEIPDGKQVLHRCDTPACVRPDHLWLGTNADNQADKLRKGRQSSVLGELCGLSKLTEPEVFAILELLERGVSLRTIAASFRVSASAIHRIKRGERWPHVFKARLPREQVISESVSTPAGARRL